MTDVFYMVEMAYPDRDGPGRAAYDGFYERHISMLLTIPGFLSAQRFECLEEARAPFLAVYRLADAEVLERPSYRTRAGRLSVPEEFRERMQNWDRNLLQGEAGTLEVASGGGGPDGDGPVLTVLDRLDPSAPALPEAFAALEVIGLDRTIAERGVRVGPPWELAAPPSCTVRNFRPLHPLRKPG